MLSFEVPDSSFLHLFIVSFPPLLFFFTEHDVISWHQSDVIVTSNSGGFYYCKTMSHTRVMTPDVTAMSHDLTLQSNPSQRLCLYHSQTNTQTNLNLLTAGRHQNLKLLFPCSPPNVIYQANFFVTGKHCCLQMPISVKLVANSEHIQQFFFL